MKNCLECGREFKPTHDNRKICSNACRINRAENKKIVPFKAQRTGKKCTKCGVLKKLEEFGTRLLKVSGNITHKSMCKECEKKSANEWYEKHPDKKNDRMRKYRYGMSNEEFDILKNEQNGKCKLCGLNMKKPNVDHCHKTGKVRGIICMKCNAGLGLFNDDVELLKKAIQYLSVT